MGIMIYSTIGVFVIVLFFVYILMVIFKQKRLSEIKTDFINNMTHEFKTPIATISIASEQLMKENTLNNPHKIKTYSQIIKDECLRLKSQVDQILNIALLDSTRTQLKKTSVDFHTIITDVTEKIKIQANEKKCLIHLDLKAEKHTIQGDADHLTNVMFNLMDNALKYSKENPQIIIRTKNKNHDLIVEVEDNGIGIPVKHQKMIFEKFYRIPTGNVHNVKGFGLGLSYVKKIIQLHKGKIELESTPGIGTIFRIFLKSESQNL
jgi:two-component system phosphate regulon sensor histidine kinase PhoR